MRRHRTGRLPAILFALGLVLFASQPMLARRGEATGLLRTTSIQETQTNPSGLATETVLDLQAPPAQPQLRFERITTADGLSFPIVRDILQDQQGFLWFATDSGLDRYDGYTFTVYKEDPGDPTTIRFDSVSAIFEDSDGRLWVGGAGGLDRFDRETETFTHVDTRGQVYCLYEDSTGTLWAGFWHGLYGYDRVTNEIIHSRQPNPNAPSDWTTRTETTVTAIDEDPSGDLWIGTVAGLYRLDRATGTFTAYRHDPADSTSIASDAITALYVDRQDTLWAGTLEGLDRLDRSSGAFLHYQHQPEDSYSLGDNTVLSILEDSSGLLWVGTTAGLDQFDRRQGRFLHYRHDPDDPISLGGERILSLFEDRSGVFWVGTTDGVSKSTRREGLFTHFQELSDPPMEITYSLDLSGLLQDAEPRILSDSTITSIAEDKNGILWIGTQSGGLDKLDLPSERLTVYAYDPDDPDSIDSGAITSLFEDDAGVLWVGTGSGWLERFDPETQNFIHARQLEAAVSALAKDAAGDLWIGTGGDGLYRLDSNEITLQHYQQFWQDPDHWWRNGSLSSHIVSTLEVDQDGILWAGTIYGGINIWGTVQNRFTHHRYDPDNPDSLSHDQVLFILDDPDRGVVWIGTGGGGLNRYDRATGTFVHYSTEEGLPGDTVGCIVADDAGFLWLATIQGLSRFDPATETFRNYDRRDGVGVLSAGAAGPGSCLQSRTGEVIFGGLDGLYLFHPEEIKENRIPPPVAITALKVLGETAHRNLSGDEQIQLPYQDNFLSFEFTALDYTIPEKNQYAYRLEGLDRDWIYAGTRHYADYPDLKPGDYVFRVKGSNSDGVWNEEGIAVRITVEPPFWQTWAFRIIVAAALVLLIIGIYRQRVQNIQARSRELERQVEARTQEIKQLSEKAQELAVMEERQRLARDLHDAVSQTLFSAGLIAETLPDIWQTSPIEGRELLHKLKQLSRGALAEMRALLMELRPAALAEASMTDLLRQLGQAASGREGIPVSVTVDESCDLPAEVRITLYRIAQEALNNIVKHAQASQVDVSLRCAVPLSADKAVPGHRGRVELRIRDDGLGFDPSSVSQDHLGLGIMQERAESIRARFEVKSEPGGGTQISVVWTEDEEQLASSRGGQDE